MAVLTNKNTTQTPLVSGLTGLQVVKFLDAPRVYIKAPDTTAAPVLTKSAGVTPSGYTDLGIVSGKVKVTYSKEIKEIRTGIDQVLRQSYVGQKTAAFEFTLSQFDDIVIAALSGLTPSTITSGSAVSFGIGQEDIVQKALLLVVQNKLDGKEHQFYHPNADMSFTIEDNGEETVVKGTGNLRAFTLGSTEVLMNLSIFA